MNTIITSRCKSRIEKDAGLFNWLSNVYDDFNIGWELSKKKPVPRWKQKFDAMTNKGYFGYDEKGNLIDNPLYNKNVEEYTRGPGHYYRRNKRTINPRNYGISSKAKANSSVAGKISNFLSGLQSKSLEEITEKEQRELKNLIIKGYIVHNAQQTETSQEPTKPQEGGAVQQNIS